MAVVKQARCMKGFASEIFGLAIVGVGLSRSNRNHDAVED